MDTRRKTAASVLVAGLLVACGGCADDVAGRPEWGRTATAKMERFEMPQRVRAGFEALYPGAEVTLWNRVVGDYDRVAYVITYVTPVGQTGQAWLTPAGTKMPLDELREFEP